MSEEGCTIEVDSMDPKTAALQILKTFKGFKILGCYKYDDVNYLFSLTPKGKITSEDDFYLFNKQTGEIKGYPILNDAKKFNSVVMNKSNILNFK